MGLGSDVSVDSDITIPGTSFVVAAGVTNTLTYDQTNKMRITWPKARYKAPLVLCGGSPLIKNKARQIVKVPLVNHWLTAECYGIGVIAVYEYCHK